MQALSLTVHIPIVCFGIAFPAMMLFVEGLYLRTGDAVYKALAKRWSKVAVTLFAVGVVTGTILSFEFGLLWPEFMARYGEVFGIGFALEGISFFVEAIFIAIYVYGWDRLPKRTHFLTGIPVVLSGFAGSFNVIAVNGWMNDPTGFDLGPNGEVLNPQPWSALLNANMWHELIHMYLAGYLVCGFIVAGVYAHAWLKGRRDQYVRTALVVTLAFASLVGAGAGDRGRLGGARGRRAPAGQARGDGRAAGDDRRRVRSRSAASMTRRAARCGIGIEVPKLLSLLARHDPNARIEGLETVPAEDRPPVNIVRYAFQTMVGIGTFLALLGVFFVWVWWRRRALPLTPWFYRAVMAAGPLSFVALIAGWITTEVGRQPWIVYEVMRTEEAVTQADGLEVGYIALIVVYLGVGAAVVWLLRRLASKPPETEVTGG